MLLKPSTADAGCAPGATAGRMVNPRQSHTRDRALRTRSPLLNDGSLSMGIHGGLKAREGARFGAGKNRILGALLKKRGVFVFSLKNEKILK